MIKIYKSQRYDTKPVDGKINVDNLFNETKNHSDDVLDAMLFFANQLVMAGEIHDYTKIQNFDAFHKALESGKIKDSSWYKLHTIEERHHLLEKIPPDITLIDVMEYISDCVMAGMVRSGTVYDITLSDKLLKTAFYNTIEMLKKEVIITDKPEEDKNGNESDTTGG